MVRYSFNYTNLIISYTLSVTNHYLGNVVIMKPYLLVAYFPVNEAGIIIEYSSIYYSIIVLTEYTNIIALTLFMIIIFSLTLEILLLVLYTTSLTRPTLVRLKFDELMINVWVMLIPIVFVVMVVWMVIYFSYKILIGNYTYHVIYSVVFNSIGIFW